MTQLRIGWTLLLASLAAMPGCPEAISPGTDVVSQVEVAAETLGDQGTGTPDTAKDVGADIAADTVVDTAVVDTAVSDTVSDTAIADSPSDTSDDDDSPDAATVACDQVATSGWSLCSESATTCEFVFQDSTGCPQACASLGLACGNSFENTDSGCGINSALPALGCSETGHISDYCICGVAAPDSAPDAADSADTEVLSDTGSDGNAGPDASDGGDTETSPPGPLLAFPSARGAGAYATGGRGGQVIRVTTLADSGPGSLREALQTPGPRIITFAVSGTIVLSSTIGVSNGDFTLAGQTAPAGGVTVAGTNRLIALSGASNFIVRYIRIRPTYSTFDALGLINCSNYIFDHVSVSWGGDEVMTTRGDTDNVTWQRILLAEGKTGSLFGDSNDPSLSENLSFHHNVYYNVTHRHPNVHTFGRADVYNNLIFNWKFRWSVVIGDVQLNHLNNYYSQGCVDSPNGGNSFMKVFYNTGYIPEIFSAGNLVMPTFLTDPSADNWVLWNWRVDVEAGPYTGAVANTQLTYDYKLTTGFPLLGPPTVLDTAQGAFDDLIQDVGANRRLDASGAVIADVDALDTLYLDDIATGECISYQSSSQGQNYDETAHYAAFQATVSTTPLALGYADSNQDGIPDAWKLANGQPVDADLTSYVWPSGYVGIEEFLNEIDKSN